MRIGRAAPPEKSIHFTVDGQVFSAYPGDTVAAALYASGVRAWRRTRHGQERGLFCDIGICCDCLVVVDGQPNVRACLSQVKDGMMVETSLGRKLNS